MGSYITIYCNLQSVSECLKLLKRRSTKVYNAEGSGRYSTILPEPSDDSVIFRSLAVAGDYAAVGDNRGVVRMVNLKTKQTVETIPSREIQAVTHVDLSKNAKTLTYHADGVAYVVHLEIADN